MGVVRIGSAELMRYRSGTTWMGMWSTIQTAIINWFYQGMNIFDVMKLAGYSKYETTYRFNFQVKDGLMD